MTEQDELRHQTLDEAKADKIIETKQQLQIDFYAPLVFEGNTFIFPNKQLDQANLSIMCHGCTNPAWVDEHGVVRITTMEKLLDFSKMLADRGQNLFNEKNIKVARINSATTKEQVRKTKEVI